jgi:DNA topoisomerase-6 subunit A
MSGVPTRATRRFIRRLAEGKKIPVYAFVDCDPYGISNIYRTLKVGSATPRTSTASSACRTRPTWA